MRPMREWQKLGMVLVLGALWASGAWAGLITPSLQAQLDKAAPGEKLKIIVRMNREADLSTFPAGQWQAMVRHLKTTAEASQRDLLATLPGYGNKVAKVRPFWIINAIALEATRDVVSEIAQNPKVGGISEDRVIHLDPVTPTRGPGINSIEWNLTIVQVPQAWALGYNGAGIVVGNMDTGVDVTHPTFGGRYRGGNNSWFDGVNGQTTPYDDHGHGTHTMGTICGGSGADTIGVARGATFVAAKAFDSGGSGQDSWILACYQWFAGTSRPNVFGNSWGTSAGATTTFWQASRNCQILGIHQSYSNGNSGPGSGTVGAPASYPHHIGVGATDNADVIASFSSRGPSPTFGAMESTANYLDPNWASSRRKPDLSAPGVNVRSAAPGGGWATMSGTSMASPHVTGAIALMLQKNSNLTDKDIWRILTTTCDTPAAGRPYPNQDYGWGRLNVYRALLAVAPPVPHHNMQASGIGVPAASWVPQNTTIAPAARFRNGGTYDETNIPVTYLIRIGANTVYTSNRTIPALASHAETTVVFDNFTVGPVGTHYQAIGFCRLPGDTFVSDDTTKKSFVAARVYEVPLPGGSAWKYPNADSGAIPVPTHSSWIPATSGEIQQIGTLDSNWWVTAGATDSVHQDLQLYGFRVQEPLNLLEQVILDWWGHHGNPPADRCGMYFWNRTAGAWSQRALQTPVSSDVNFSSALSGDSARVFLDTNGQFYTSTKADVYIKSSCPLLFAWNGMENAFVGDVLAGGDLGTWLGRFAGTNLYLPPDNDEYVKLSADQLKETDGKYCLTVNEMLQEVSYLDAVRLVAVDHPARYGVYPQEGLWWPGYQGLKILTCNDQPLRSATDSRGRDILSTLKEADRIFAPFEKTRVAGFAKPFTITLDVGDLEDPSKAVLYLFGSTRFPDAGEIGPVSDIYQAGRNGMLLKAPKVEVLEANGRWKKVATCGMPAGHQKTVTYPLCDQSGRSIFATGDHRVRITFTSEVYLDKAWVSSRQEDDYRLCELSLSTANLRYYGFAAYGSEDGNYPGDFSYAQRVDRDYARAAGYYTRYGDVGPLLTESDDRLVVMGSGDEVALEFDARALPKLPQGWQRDFVFAAKGFYKMGRPGRAYAYSVDPLPFRGMRGDLSASGIGYYPYDPSPNLLGSLLGRMYARAVWDYPFTFKDALTLVKTHLAGKVQKAYPADPKLVEYCQEWNTRQVNTYYPAEYADLPPHVNAERVPLREKEGTWPVRLASLGIPFGDHSLHSNYVRLVVITTQPLGVETQSGAAPGIDLQLEVGHPNPFRTSTGIRYALPQETELRLDVFDVSGRRMRSLVQGKQKPGTYQVAWDGTDGQGRRLAAGVYLVRLVAGDRNLTRKVVLLK